MIDDYSHLIAYIETIDGVRQAFVTHAPDKARILHNMLISPSDIRVHVTGTVAFTAANGTVVYEIEGTDERGALRCRKVSDTLTPYTPIAERNAQRGE